ncbi:hypothetical protein M758_UG162400 [Ceratodon purpureus]|nr:hypothetical protein M758_N015800 [Ceratodon purpureus]KAG0595389.1 hypothetical protein M758_UG162400 [Ceratodon purpureus]
MHFAKQFFLWVVLFLCVWFGVCLLVFQSKGDQSCNFLCLKILVLQVLISKLGKGGSDLPECACVLMDFLVAVGLDSSSYSRTDF